MTWYKVKTSDGAEHRLWFGHDPSESDVLEHLKAPKVAESSSPLADQPDKPEVGVGGSPLQRAIGTEADPNSPEVMAKALILGASAPGGPLAGGIARGGSALLRAATSPPVAGGAVGASLGALESGGDLKHTLIGGAAGAGLPVVGQGVAKLAGKAISSALSARLAHTLAREAPEAISAIEAALIESGASKATARGVAAAEMAGAGKAATGEVSANLPGVMTPAGGTAAIKLPAVAAAQQIEAQVQTLRAAGLSKPQIVHTLRGTYGHDNLPADAAEKMVDMITESSGSVAPVMTEVLPTGRKVMPSPRGGKAQPYLGPAEVPRDEAHLRELLAKSLKAYELP